MRGRAGLQQQSFHARALSLSVSLPRKPSPAHRRNQLRRKLQPIAAFLSPPASLQPSPRYCSPIASSKQQAIALFDTLPKPISGAQVLELFHSYLPTYEQAELAFTSEVYFLGLKAAKQRAVGFEDKRGDYHVSLGDHLAYRYEILQILGKGAFAQVVKCFDHLEKQLCAVKIVRNLERFQQQAQVEIAILQHLKSRDKKDSQRIVRIHADFVFRGHICLVFELLSSNLYQLLKLNQFRGLSEGLIRRLAAQMLLALRFMRKERVIHCDIKPENILLKAADRSSIKVIDFGSASFADRQVFTYIQSRFYRAPEVLLGLKYGVEVDMWSLGCVVAELALGEPLLQGRNESEQMELMVNLCGIPPSDMLERAPKRSLFFTNEGQLRTSSTPGSRPLAEVLPTASPGLLDLVSRNLHLECLQWEPSLRLTPDEGLKHKWFLNDISS